LLKYTLPTHADYRVLNEAYDEMARLADYINERKRQVYILSLSEFTNDLLTICLLERISK